MMPCETCGDVPSKLYNDVYDWDNEGGNYGCNNCATKCDGCGKLYFDDDLTPDTDMLNMRCPACSGNST